MAGARKGVFINLRIKEVDFDKKIIFVRGGKGKKNGKTILADYAILVLKKYINPIIGFLRELIESNTVVQVCFQF